MDIAPKKGGDKKVFDGIARGPGVNKGRVRSDTWNEKESLQTCSQLATTASILIHLN